MRRDWRDLVLAVLITLVVSLVGTWFAWGQSAVTRGELEQRLAKIDRIDERLDRIEAALARLEGRYGPW